MKWRIPETEEAWEECLSAYMDGEISPDDISELEKYLNKNPEHLAQLEKLKKTSVLLHEWKIDAPIPDAAFIREVRKQAKSKEGFILIRWARSLRMQAVVPSFLIGLLAGIVFMSVTGKDNTVSTQVNRAENLKAEYSISQSQANMLFAEADAEMLKVKILNALKTMDADTVRETYEKLKAKYPESRALRDLSGNRKLQFLQT